MSDAEYEVESVSKARVDAKRGKKIIWKYYVKWKGYSWDDSTWEPEKSFTAGSKHFLKTFWAHALTRGREHTNPQLFEKGEEVHVSGFPGASPRLETRSSRDNLQGPSETFENDASDDEPLTTKKRRRHTKPAGEPKAKRKRESEPGTAVNAPAQRTRAFGPKSKAKLSPPSKQRRASSPGPRKVEGTRQFSLTKLTDTDAEGELDMDVFGEAEVEEELMQMSPDDPDARDIPNSHSDPAKVNGTIVEFEDLPSYSPDIQDTIEVSQVIVEDGHLSVDEGRSSPDPLFDSISQSGNDEGSRSPVEPAVPFHRARAANPLVKFIDAAPLMDKGVVNPAKTRLISGQPSSSSRDSGSNASQKARPKPGPGGRSSASRGKNRSSLLTAVKGGLTSVKGRFGPAKDVREEPEPIEDAPAPSHLTEHEFAITSWSDEDAAGETDHEHLATAPLTDQMGPTSNHAPAPIPVPSGQELLEIAGLKSDAAALPDFEDEAIERPPQPTNAISVDTLADDVPTEDAASPAAMTVEDEAARKSLAEAKEQLFPSIQATASVASISSSSWKTSKDNTIFGPMYKLQEPAQGPTVNESVPTFKLILNANVPVPLVLKDSNNMKGVSFTDIYADKSLDGRAGTFYLIEDAVKIVSTFSGLGSARVVPASSADDGHRTQFDVFQQRLHSGQMFVTKAGKELLVFFSSQNAEISAKLNPPQVLIGLANTVLLMRVQITDSTGYANAVMQITAM